MKRYRDSMVCFLAFAVGSWMAVAQAQAQTTPSAEPSQRLELGGRFSVAAPIGDGWRKTGEPASYIKVLGPEHHSLILAASTGPSGITREDISGFREPGGVERMIKLMARFSEMAWKAHAAGLEGSRFEAVEKGKMKSGKNTKSASSSAPTRESWCVIVQQSWMVYLQNCAMWHTAVSSFPTCVKRQP